jgi:hypothetical protein
MHQKVSSSGFE